MNSVPTTVDPRNATFHITSGCRQNTIYPLRVFFFLGAISVHPSVLFYYQYTIVDVTTREMFVIFGKGTISSIFAEGLG